MVIKNPWGIRTTGSEKFPPLRQLGYPRDLQANPLKSKNLFWVLPGPVVFPACPFLEQGAPHRNGGQAPHDYSWFGFFDVME